MQALTDAPKEGIAIVNVASPFEKYVPPTPLEWDGVDGGVGNGWIVFKQKLKSKDVDEYKKLVHTCIGL